MLSCVAWRGREDSVRHGEARDPAREAECGRWEEGPGSGTEPPPFEGGARVPPSSPRRTLQGSRAGPLMTWEESKGLETLS